MTIPLIVTVFTEGTPYADDAAALARSAQAFGYAVRSVGMPDAGSWWANVAGKPQSLYDVMRSHDGPVLFLDADCRVVAPLDGLAEVVQRCDVAAVRRPANCFTARINSGVVLFNATDAARAVAREWAERASRYARFHRFGDQGALGEALAAARPAARFQALPSGWNTDAIDGKPASDCAIMHLKRSRTSRDGLEPPGDGSASAAATGAQRLIVLRPDPDLTPAGTYACGVVAMASDLVECARRYGFAFSEMMALHASGGASGRSGAEVLTAVRYACGREDCVAPVLLAHDSILLRDPAPVLAQLDRADVVVAWDAAHGDSLPAPGFLALRADARVGEALVPRLEQALRDRAGEDDGLAGSLAAVLRDPPPGIRVAAVPRATVATPGEVTEDTIVMRVGGWEEEAED